MGDEEAEAALLAMGGRIEWEHAGRLIARGSVEEDGPVALKGDVYLVERQWGGVFEAKLRCDGAGAFVRCPRCYLLKTLEAAKRACELHAATGDWV